MIIEMESSWISAVVIVNFEIEKGKCQTYFFFLGNLIFDISINVFIILIQGQEVELIYPGSFTLSEDELKNLSFMSFPDSNSKKETTTFHFHLRSKKIIPTQLIDYNKECLRDIKADDSHFWGYVVFKQKKDPFLKRGYFQKSFVLLSRLPFHNLFYEVIV